jgi:hypothetical protein
MDPINFRSISLVGPQCQTQQYNNYKTKTKIPPLVHMHLSQEDDNNNINWLKSLLYFIIFIGL